MTDKKRIKVINSIARGFIYFVSITGVTGERSTLPDGLKDRIDNIKSSIKLPLVLGFGISGPETIFEYAGHVDGFVVERRNTRAMAQRVAELLQDDELYKRMSKSALKMSNRYSEEIVRGNWIKLLDAVLTLPKSELSSFLYENFYKEKVKEFSQQDIEDIVKMYEEACQGIVRDNKNLTNKLIEYEGYKGLVNQMENTISWKITKPLRKFRHLIDLIRIQGLVVTTRNIILKILGK